MTNYIAPSDINGIGCFTDIDIKAGEKIPWAGDFFSSKEFRGYNHSCSPNTKISRGFGQPIIAIRDIQKGEEITVQYGIRLNDCNCPPCKAK